MITINGYNPTDSFQCIGMAGMHRLAFHGGNGGPAPRMPISREAFEACEAEIRTLDRHGLIKFEATNGETVSPATLAQVAAYFKSAPKATPTPMPEAMRMVPRQEPQPAPWMPTADTNISPETAPNPNIYPDTVPHTPED